MATPTLNYVACPDSAGGHRMAYWEWGDAQAAHTVVCVHGLSRQGRDFDVLAQALLAQAAHPMRIICPDVVGRGQSDWLQDPQGYQIPNYAADMLALLAQLKVTSVDWVGTSMGGLIGIVVCAHAASIGVKVRRLVLNDVGPHIEWAAITRIGAYLERKLVFDDLQQAADALWAVSSSFGPHTPAQWLALSQHMVKPAPDAPGKLTLHFDTGIAGPFQAVTQASAQEGTDLLWSLYDTLQTQILLIRGKESDLLSEKTAQQMTQRGPGATLVEFDGVGHAPTLVAADQVQTVTQFLLM